MTHRTMTANVLMPDEHLYQTNTPVFHTESGELVSHKAISKHDLNKALYGKVSLDSNLYDILGFKKGKIDQHEAIVKDYDALPDEKKQSYFEIELERRFHITPEQLSREFGVLSQQEGPTGQSEEDEFEFPTGSVKNWEALKKHAAQILSYASPTVYATVVRRIRVSRPQDDVRAYLMNMYRVNSSYRYACQLCHKPFSNVEMCQLEQKPDVELDPLNICLSENVTWGRRKQFSDGKVSLPYGQFLGYRKGPDGLPEIVPEEAKTVDLIYRMFRNGKSPSYIARHLTAQGIPTPGGKKVWQAQVIESILTNEKYKGDARLQKKFTTDFLTKKQKKNEGEVPQYYVKNSHPAIIEPRAWDEVQGIMKRRKASGKRHECSSPFSGIVICGDCGSVYGSKVWHSNDPYRKVIWQCNSKFKNEEKCRTPHVTEERLKDGFLEALSILHENRETLLNDIRDVKHDLENCTEVNAKITETAHEMEVIAGLIQKAIEDNAVHAQDQEEYNRRYNELADHYEKLKTKLETLEQERDDREYKSNVLSGFLFEMTEFKYLDAEFTDARCIAMLDHVTIYANGRMIYSFLNGSDITVML